MKRTLTLSMGWLHTWSGLVLGWVLFAIFLTGTATYFRWEITRWMQPELRGGVDPARAAQAALQGLERMAPKAGRWLIELPDHRTPATTAYWKNPDSQRFSSATLDPVTGDKVEARDTRGGEFFYRFHFQLQLPHPWGRYLAGLAALAMFVALVSGVIAHRDFYLALFTFRRGRGTFRSLVDAHSITATVALPFYFIISYSALVIFMSMYMPWAGRVLSASDAVPAKREVRVSAEKKALFSPPETDAVPWAAMLSLAAQRWSGEGAQVKRIEVTGRDTANGKVIFTRGSGKSVSIATREQLSFSLPDGTFIAAEKKEAGGPGTAVNGVLYGLHLARFSGPALRWTFFLMGVFGCALVATGLLLWTTKRRSKFENAGRRSLGFRVVERLNITALAGLPAAIGAFFWANRLLPVDLPARGDAEVRVFLASWGVLLLHPILRKPARAWREQLWLGAALLLGLPALDAASGPYLSAAIREVDTVYLGFHATAIFAGLLLAAAAWLAVGHRLSSRRGSSARMGQAAVVTRAIRSDATAETRT